jgi:hypothetical protein
MTISEILGVASATNKRKKHDFYETPDWSVEELCAVEDLPGVVWEPCAGRGAISRVLTRNGLRVIESDLVPRTRGQQRLDFLKLAQPLATAAVTNPLYKIATKIIRHARQIGVTYLALLRAGQTKRRLRSQGRPLRRCPAAVVVPPHVFRLQKRVRFASWRRRRDAVNWGKPGHKSSGVREFPCRANCW